MVYIHGFRWLFVALCVISASYPVLGRRDLLKRTKRGKGGWTLIWQDEFDFFDTNKWEHQYEDGCHIGVCQWGNREQSWYTDKNTMVRGGRLRIQAREEKGHLRGRVQQNCWDYCGHLCAQKGLVGDILSGCVQDCGANRCPQARFTSSRIRTFGKFSIAPSDTYQVVRIEARIKLSSGKGLWPAFWMLPEEGARPDCSGCGKYGEWPASGEIDIMETFGQMKGVNGTLHFGGVGAWSHLTRSTELKPGYHVYSLEWERDEIRWYLDDEQYGRVRRATISTPGWWTTGSETGPFDVNFHILLNLAIGGEYTGNVSPEEISRTLEQGQNTMDVDFVRVYGKKR